ncbi:MAG: hypothetical protein A4E20_03000 [Nitrospira sp. SG-bin2]|jgi:hypothetical protein|uniref:hypothetical protein n=1 Tax=Nitrospira cf. moscoviensis SBR1015 TaxID=96242 RepID=UPI000A0D52F0|nr:hypothetical protein [Nitrospira cf. moscoviensis SBR1015]OQW32104.1 MAG: hypothetical protein A4E20_03000 [Nitrospira sp. SG-bin2]
MEEGCPGVVSIWLPTRDRSRHAWLEFERIDSEMVLVLVVLCLVNLFKGLLQDTAERRLVSGADAVPWLVRSQL